MQFAVGYQLPEPDADEKPLTRIVAEFPQQRLTPRSSARSNLSTDSSS